MQVSGNNNHGYGFTLHETSDVESVEEVDFDEELEESIEFEDEDIKGNTSGKKRKRKAEPIPNGWKNYLGRGENHKYYHLTGLNWCATWNLVDALRDLFQNAVDSMLDNHRRTPQHRNCHCWVTLPTPPSLWNANESMILPFQIMDESGKKSRSPCGYLCWEPQGLGQQKGPVFTIINLNASFGPKALTIGCSSKGSDDAGGHGEGLKAVVGVAIRADLLFEIYQSHIGIQFSQSSCFIY